MRQLRCDPHFAPLFRHVHPLCWPILWWSLNCIFLWFDHCGYENVMLATTRWGYVYPAFMGEKTPDPSAYKPYVLEKPRWDDPRWSTRAPVKLVVLAASETLAMIPNPPPRSGGGGGLRSLWRSRLTEGTSALSFIDTS
ncbi:hypothetical protein [Hyphomonas sp.]|uniref:hypothetical protein n=1 Tax=Hyphomonas sp. TaxID=87 RepID=UPI003918716B